MGKKLSRFILTESGQFVYAKTGRQVAENIARELTVSNGRVYRKGRLYGTLPGKLTKTEQEKISKSKVRHKEEWEADWEKRYKIRIDALVENAFRGLDNTVAGAGSGFSFETAFNQATTEQRIRIFNEFDHENWDREFRLIYEETLGGLDPMLGTFGRLVQRFLAAVDGVDVDLV